MIILFSANNKGGLVQFTVQLLNTIKKCGSEAIAVMPEDVLICEELQDVINYKYCNTINGLDSRIEKIAKEILNLKPELVIFTDNKLLSMQVLLKLSKKVKTVQCIHDIQMHPSHNMGMKFRIKRSIKNIYCLFAEKSATFLMFMSESSKKKYLQKKYKYSQKSLVLRLGAHVPNIKEKKIEELNNITDYYLFFGRFDKYKGILNMVKNYNEIKKIDIPELIIAGDGILTEEEKLEISKSNKIRLVKRYIYDDEMVYLFKNAKAVILPYIEASQSGVLSMAYYYSIPVIVSNLEGLTEFVKENETGIIFKTNEELKEAFININDKITNQSMKKCVSLYYDKNLQWEKNWNSVYKKIIL